MHTPASPLKAWRRPNVGAACSEQTAPQFPNSCAHNLRCAARRLGFAVSQVVHKPAATTTLRRSWRTKWARFNSGWRATRVIRRH
eukprot:6067853-Pleurochrysis_carterae.AAC.2